MKQSAVEWLINNHFGSIENCTPDFRLNIKKAIEMEKEIIDDAIMDYIMNRTTKHEVLIDDSNIDSMDIDYVILKNLKHSNYKEEYNDWKNYNSKYG